MNRRVAVVSLCLFVTSGSAAQAQEPPTPISIQVQLRAGAVVSGDRFVIRGTAPGAAGVQLRLRRDGRSLVKRTLVPESDGQYQLKLRAPGAGALELRAAPLDAAGAAIAPAAVARAAVLPRAVRAGSPRAHVEQLQEHLRAKGYVLGRRGRYDARTRRAVLAFRKVTEMSRTTRASTPVMRRLARGGGQFRVRFPEHGRHLEADLSRQVLALIGADGRVERIYPTSSGARATPTVRGSYRVYRRDRGTNALGMVHAVYFIGGYAVHGFASVPTYPASHGCLRVPVPDALSIFRWLRKGTRVDTYR